MNGIRNSYIRRAKRLPAGRQGFVIRKDKNVDCVFCKISRKQIPADIVYENDDILAFRDLHPIAPVHILVIPKKHIASIADISEEDAMLMGKLIAVAKKIAEDLKISEKGYKLLFRVGEHGGQEVGHIHLHLLGGARLSENIKPV